MRAFFQTSVWPTRPGFFLTGRSSCKEPTGRYDRLLLYTGTHFAPLLDTLSYIM
jgi:hypothetical protein